MKDMKAFFILPKVKKIKPQMREYTVSFYTHAHEDP